MDLREHQMGDKHSMNRAIVIVEAAYLAAARSLLQQEPFNQTPEEAAETFVPMGSPTGNAPATYYWLSAELSDAALAACQQLCTALSWATCHSYNAEANPQTPSDIRTNMSLQPIKPQI